MLLRLILQVEGVEGVVAVLGVGGLEAAEGLLVVGLAEGEEGEEEGFDLDVHFTLKWFLLIHECAVNQFTRIQGALHEPLYCD